MGIHENAARPHQLCQVGDLQPRWKVHGFGQRRYDHHDLGYFILAIRDYGCERCSAWMCSTCAYLCEVHSSLQSHSDHDCCSGHPRRPPSPMSADSRVHSTLPASNPCHARFRLLLYRADSRVLSTACFYNPYLSRFRQLFYFLALAGVEWCLRQASLWTLASLLLGRRLRHYTATFIHKLCARWLSGHPTVRRLAGCDRLCLYFENP